VPIRTGSRISAIFASRLGSENRVLAAIYNHDTRAKNVQYGVLGSGLGGVHPLQLSRAAKTMQTDVRSQAFVANAAGNVRNVGQMLAVMMVLCLSMLGIIAFWLAAIITHADVFATLTLICLATTIVSGAFLALTLVSSKFRETRIEFELRPHVSRLLDSMDNA